MGDVGFATGTGLPLVGISSRQIGVLYQCDLLCRQIGTNQIFKTLKQIQGLTPAHFNDCEIQQMLPIGM
jgi:hypothetical protein